MNESVDQSSALPSSRTLLRSTAVAMAVACLVLVSAVLPAEYGIDPTGIGRVLGLTQMGKLKLELAKEAEADAAQDLAASVAVAIAPAAQPSTTHSDSMIVNLKAGTGIEVKLAMLKGQRADYSWQLDSGMVYYDLHGETQKLPRSAPHRYSEGTLRGAQGAIMAEFDGVHGWFWENRSSQDVRIVVKAWGQFQGMREM